MSIGTPIYGAFTGPAGGNHTPTPGGAYAIGDLLIYATGEFFGSQILSFPDNTWTLLSDNNSCKQVQLYGKIALSASEVIPTVNWGTGSIAYSGLLSVSGVDPGLLNQITTGERLSNTTLNIIGTSGSRLPARDNCILIFLGARNKTAATNGSSYSFGVPTNWTLGAQLVPNGSNPSVVFGHWIQTTATATAPNTAWSGSGSPESSGLTMQSTMIALSQTLQGLPASGGDYQPDNFYQKSYHASRQEFWQVPDTIRSLPPPAMPNFCEDLSLPIRRPF